MKTCVCLTAMWNNTYAAQTKAWMVKGSWIIRACSHSADVSFCWMLLFTRRNVWAWSAGWRGRSNALIGCRILNDVAQNTPTCTILDESHKCCSASWLNSRENQWSYLWASSHKSPGSGKRSTLWLLTGAITYLHPSHDRWSESESVSDKILTQHRIQNKTQQCLLSCFQLLISNMFVFWNDSGPLKIDPHWESGAFNLSVIPFYAFVTIVKR